MYQVSVLVPVYGVERFIERCARSLFEQTYANLEYIFVDDCSPDNSIAILEKVMEDYPERKELVRIIHHERNRGLAAARNTAIDAAQGSFITHVDSDDYLDRDAIRLLVEKQVETGADIVSGNYYVVQRNGIKKEFEPEYKSQHEMLMKVLSPRSNSLFIWRRLINIRLYKDHNVRPKEGVDNSEDRQQTALLVYYAKKVVKIDNHFYYYDCTNSDSYTFTSLNESSVDQWNQAVESATIVEDFFSDKEQIYRNMARRSKVYAMKVRMSLAARHRERSFFEKMKKLITTEYTDCYDEIGWENFIVRTFMCNYTLNGIYRRLLYSIKSLSHR